MHDDEQACLVFALPFSSVFSTFAVLSVLSMSTLTVISLMAVALMLGTYIWVGFALARLSWNPPAASFSTPLPQVTIVIPARNEAADIEATIRSLLNQEMVQVSIIVVNDHSSDATPQILARFANDARVQVLHDPPLTPGWLGKVNAMQFGLNHTQADLLLFADADIHFAPKTLATAVAEMQFRELDFLSLLPKVTSESHIEHALLPAYYLGVAQLAGPGLRNPQSPCALAAGAFMLIKRRVLTEIGGLEPLHDQALDDVTLARILKVRAYNIDVFAAPEFLTVRLFKSNYDAFWGLTKNGLAMVSNRWWLVPPMLFGNALGLWLPGLCVFFGLWQRNWAAVILALAALLIQGAVATRCRWLFDFRYGRLWCAWLEPIPVTCCYIRATYYRLRRGGVFWRGRVIPHPSQPTHPSETV
jgi:glycosyltransferase involved in cell wall biosynthesis